MSAHEPFHSGEIFVQERSGERALGQRNGAILHNLITPAACRFLGQQRTVAAAVLDALGRPRATLWLGEPGFVHSADGRELRLELRLATSFATDPIGSELAAGARIGLLAIELGSRRRMRINGSISQSDREGAIVSVEQAFANCPKYVQRRELATRGDRKLEPSSPVRGTLFGPSELELLARTDTAFVASLHEERGLDVSHRGGAPGFIRALDERTLRFPDYPGNSMFQTLGNLSVDARAGVALIDFREGRALSLTGRARLLFDQPEDPAQPSGGTGRYWELRLEEWIAYSLPALESWQLLERSPFNPLPSAGGASEDVL